MTERNEMAIKLLSVQILLPLVLVFSSYFISSDGYLFSAAVQLYLILLFLAGYWEFFGFLFRTVFIAALELLLILSVIVKQRGSVSSEINLPLEIVSAAVAVFLFFHLIKILLTVFRREKDSREIFFPFKEGHYLITDGGNSRTSRLMNYHFYSPVHRKKNTHNSMLFATDIVKTDRSSRKFLVKKNEEYPVFGEKIFSPMAGTVIRIENGVDDNRPFIGDYPYNTGNTVVIGKEDNYFLLGHMKKGSIPLTVGQEIEAGDFIGLAGNSGYSERPHLHMQLIKSSSTDFWQGTGISIQFRGKNLYKNRKISL